MIGTFDRLFRRRPATRRGSFARRSFGLESLEHRLLLSNAPLPEIEPNDTLAQFLPLGFDANEQSELIVSGAISSSDDQDWYQFDLNAGDVIGVSVVGNDRLDTTLSLLKPDSDSGYELLILNDDHGLVSHNQWTPNESPLPTATSENSEDSVIQYVINTGGTYFIKVDANLGSTGNYRMNLVVARPGLESEPEGAHQILFVDLDGVTVNMSTLYGSGVKTLSPLRDFLPRWGLEASDENENAVINEILANIEENLVTDIKREGNNRDFALEIRNSRDHEDQFGSNPYMSRVIIGGSRAEAGIPFFATAQHVDVGNFSFDDDALVTLDRQSAPTGSEGSLNSVPLNPKDRDQTGLKIQLIGEVVGRQAAHEAGHNFGNYHTDRDNDVPNVMDQAGLRYLAGPDGYFGTRDDLDIDFGVDVYAGISAAGFEEPFENTGVNDTLNTVAFGLTTGKAEVATNTADTPTAFSVLALESNTETASLVQTDPTSVVQLPLGLGAGQQETLTVQDAIASLGQRDWYEVQLNTGDVLGVAVVGHAQLDPTVSLHTDDGTLLMFNDNHRLYSDNFFLPQESPLPRINATSDDSILHYVIAQDGTYLLQVAAQGDSSTGGYKMELLATRSGMESQPAGASQTIFVDFDGATVNMNKFFTGSSVGQRTLSPLARFLPYWGLDAADENALIDVILTNIQKDFHNVLASNINPDADLIIRNSRDHADTYGVDPYVSRLIIGGTQAEADVEGRTRPFFAFAQHVDLGNFDFDDDAIVLLDEFSGMVPGFFNYAFDLNRVPLKKDTTELKIEMIGKTIANVGSHEIGHNLGNYHTDSTNFTFGIMDNGDPRGFQAAAPGVGRDGIYGTHDDEDREFVVDVYHPDEAFGNVGVNNTLNTTAFALSTGTAPILTAAAIEPLLILPSATLREDSPSFDTVAKDAEDELAVAVDTSLHSVVEEDEADSWPLPLTDLSDDAVAIDMLEEALDDLEEDLLDSAVLADLAIARSVNAGDM